MRSLLTIALALGVAVGNSAQADTVKWSSVDGGNNHHYQVVSVPSGITWENARERALKLGGKLATIESEAEKNFVSKLVKDKKYWFSKDNRLIGPWLGGYQGKDSSVENASWYWLGGEALAYSNWLVNLPTNGKQSYLHYVSENTDSTSAKWGYSDMNTQVTAFVVEHDKNPDTKAEFVANLPHILLCLASDGNTWVFELHGYGTPATNAGIVYAHQAAGYRSIVYTLDGEYRSHVGDSLSDCAGKSLKALAEEGKALYMFK